jgi:hypothetical protein
MTEGDVLTREVERYRAWLKERYPWMAEAERERLLRHLVEIRRFIHMIKYEKKPDTQEYVQ